MSKRVETTNTITQECSFTNIENINKEERSIVHYVSSEAINRYGYIVKQEGIDWTNFDKTGKNVLFNHNDESENFPIIGRNGWHIIEGDKTKVKTFINENKTKNPFVALLAEDIWNGVLNGWKPSSSLHFFITEDSITLSDGTPIINKSEALNYAFVINPANTDAVTNFTNAFKDTDLKSDQIKFIFNQFELKEKINSIDEMREKLLSDLNSISERIRILEDAKNEIKVENKKEVTNTITEVLQNTKHNFLTEERAKSLLNEILFGKMS